ncbi:MAG: hypothetical protein PVS2B2_05900 [Candidatus Acidiferrum sp.]
MLVRIPFARSLGTDGRVATAFGYDAMNLFDEKSVLPLDPPEPSTPHTEALATPGITLSGDPIPYAGGEPPTAFAPDPSLPEDLQISWYWPHLICFLVYLVSLIVTWNVLALYYAMRHHISAKQLQDYVSSDPGITFGTTLLTYAAVFLFLYVTLSALRKLPFWHSLGWRKIQPRDSWQTSNSLVYLGMGSALSFLVAIASSKIEPPEHAPIQELFKHRTSALLFMGIAVLIAPLVEETVFRGYLYPVFARILAALGRNLGLDATHSVRAGIGTSIVLTGILFGLMHGPQLGGSRILVAVLIFVGIIFTIVRARTGSVLASYMVHLGYNSFIVVVELVGTRGFTKLPPGH